MFARGREKKTAPEYQKKRDEPNETPRVTVRDKERETHACTHARVC